MRKALSRRLSQNFPSTQRIATSKKTSMLKLSHYRSLRESACKHHRSSSVPGLSAYCFGADWFANSITITCYTLQGICFLMGVVHTCLMPGYLDGTALKARSALS